MQRAEIGEATVGNRASELAWELQRLQGTLWRKPAEMEAPADSLQAQYPPPKKLETFQQL